MPENNYITKSCPEWLTLERNVEFIKGAIVGKKEIGHRGFALRIEALEADMDELKTFKQKVVAYASMASAAGAAVMTLILKLI